MFEMTQHRAHYDAYLIHLAEDAAEQLQGTCKSIVELGSKYEDEDNQQVFLNRLDELVFECQRCNWWCEHSEMANRKDGEWICEDCTEDDERNEE